MILKSDEIATRIDADEHKSDPLVIAPQPDLVELKKAGTASLDLRLGTWFLEPRKMRTASLEISDKGKVSPQEDHFARTHYTPLGKKFILHPRTFLLGVTLEWIRLPSNLAAYVIGKSSWGRRGLIIATAVGVHPGFTGCLTLEISNVGEVPIEIRPGMLICQLFLHTVQSPSDPVSASKFGGHRKPTIGEITMDPIAQKLSEGFSASD